MTDFADTVLWPTRHVLGYKNINLEIDSKNPEEVLVCQNIFVRIILIPVALLLLPLSLLALGVKWLDSKDANIRVAYSDFIFQIDRLKKEIILMKERHHQAYR